MELAVSPFMVYVTFRVVHRQSFVGLLWLITLHVHLIVQWIFADNFSTESDFSVTEPVSSCLQGGSHYQGCHEYLLAV